MKVYTKTGDKGTTGLVGGTRVEKDDIRLDTYGTTDELNSFLGLLITEISDEKDYEYLTKIQNKLFDIGGYLASDQKVYTPKEPIKEKDIKEMEEYIDSIQKKLPTINNFIIPGGSKGAAYGHICRTICRRCERKIYTLSKHYKIDENVSIFINRLSDFFFVLSRKECLKKSKEKFWIKYE